jgi:hypothetical protein
MDQRRVTVISLVFNFFQTQSSTCTNHASTTTTLKNNNIVVVFAQYDDNAFIIGVSSQRIATTMKEFHCNNNESVSSRHKIFHRDTNDSNHVCASCANAFV